MKLFIIITIALSSLLITACASKPQYKNTTVLKKGDSMETAIAIWGEPDYVSKMDVGKYKKGTMGLLMSEISSM